MAEMRFRTMGKTGFTVSEMGLGTWQAGGRWGEPFDERNAEKILHAAIDAGINFIDTADVYAGGESERAVGKVVRERKEEIYVATKCGRRLDPHTASSYTPEALRGFVEESLRNTGLDTLDLVQLHCPPGEVYDRPEIFGLFESLQEEGKIRHMGVSVEKVEEALRAMRFENVSTVQIIFNMFRLKPAEEFFPEAASREVGVIARVPLASGLLTGTFSGETSFARDDHRHFNRDGQAFDKGETFSGVDFDTGLEAVEKLRKLFPGRRNLAPVALAWILMHEEVSTVIPGASRVDQLVSNLKALEEPSFTALQEEGVKRVYETYLKDRVHHLW